MDLNSEYERIFNQFNNEPLDKIPDQDKEYFQSYFCKSKGFTHLMKLVLCENDNNTIKLIENILNKSPDEINKQNEKGSTALMIICTHAHTDLNLRVIKLLLNHQFIDINLTCHIGCTALIHAAKNQGCYNNELIKLLLDHPKINVNIFSKYEYSALDCIIGTKDFDRGIVLSILKKINNYNYLDKYLKYSNFTDIENLQFIYINSLYNKNDYTQLLDTLYYIYNCTELDKNLINKKIYRDVCQYKQISVLREKKRTEKRFEDDMLMLDAKFIQIQEQIKKESYILTISRTKLNDCTIMIN